MYCLVLKSIVIFFLRRQVFEFLNGIVKQASPQLKLFGTGSTRLHTYLPGGDFDIVVLIEGESEVEVLSTVFASLLRAGTEAVSSNSTLFMKNIEFINARTKLIHCITSGGLHIDITVNQKGKSHHCKHT